MAITDDAIAVIKSWVGSGWDEDDISDRFDRLGSYDATVTEILNQQIADLAAQPSSLSVPGFSISQGQNMSTLKDTLERFLATGGTGIDDEVDGVKPVRFIQGFRPDYNRVGR